MSKLKQVRTVREFDEAYTAPYFGFAGAEDYYHRASAMRIIERIRVPALVITADDDPFVPSEPFRDPKLTGNPCVQVAICEHGGHCGFVGPASAEDDGYWAENQIVEFVESAQDQACLTLDLYVTYKFVYDRAGLSCWPSTQRSRNTKTLGRAETRDRRSPRPARPDHRLPHPPARPDANRARSG